MQLSFAAKMRRCLEDPSKADELEAAVDEKTAKFVCFFNSLLTWIQVVPFRSLTSLSVPLLPFPFPYFPFRSLTSLSVPLLPVLFRPVDR